MPGGREAEGEDYWVPSKLAATQKRASQLYNENYWQLTIITIILASSSSVSPRYHLVFRCQSFCSLFLFRTSPRALSFVSSRLWLRFSSEKAQIKFKLGCLYTASKSPELERLTVACPQSLRNFSCVHMKNRKF